MKTLRFCAALLLLAPCTSSFAQAQGAASDESNPAYELQPLVITAPRLKIPPTLLIDGRINAVLLNLLQNSATYRPSPDDLNDAAIPTLHALSSPVGFQLQMRYTELGFLLAEGLAGTADLNLKQAIVNVAMNGTDSQVRAAAMIALAYDKNPGDHGVFQSALQNQDLTLRFAAMNALQIWGQEGAVDDILTEARMDQSTVLQIYAASLLMKDGRTDDARDILIRHFEDSDWAVRAMAIRYLGEFGKAEDYDRILFDLQNETNNFVKAEMCGALLRLFRLKSKQ